MDRLGLAREIAAYKTAKEAEAARARQMAALQLACHVDLADTLNCGEEGRKLLVLRLERMIERERLRGARKHWSYDLNRHIALKQALNGLTKDESRSEQPSSRESRPLRRRKARRPSN